MAKKMTNEMNKAHIKNIIVGMDALITEHEAYVEKYVRGGNAALYVLIGKMLERCIEICSSDKHEQILDEMRKVLRSKGLKLQASSKPSNIVVRYITGRDRKTAHVYGRVINAAMEDKIAPADLPAYITSKGGIDKVRQSVVKAAAVEKHFKHVTVSSTALAEELQTRNCLGEVILKDGVRAKLPGSADVEFTYLMCKGNPQTGKLEVVSALYPSAIIEREALTTQLQTAIAATFDGTGEFHAQCKDQSLNMDQVHKWMKCNKLDSAEEAKVFLTKLRQRVASMPKPKYTIDAEINFPAFTSVT